MNKFSFFKVIAIALASCISVGQSCADIFTTGFFSGTIERFDANGVQTRFTTLSDADGLSGIAHSTHNNQFYVSSFGLFRGQSGVYRVDMNGDVLAYTDFTALNNGYLPGGLTVGENGNVFISDMSSPSVHEFDADMNHLRTINITQLAGVDNAGTGGVGFASNGNLIIATAGMGIFQYDFNTDAVTPFSRPEDAMTAAIAGAQVATNGTDIFIGHGFGYVDSALRFDSNGNIIGDITITADMMPGAPDGSSDGFSPSGLAFDSNGDLIVAVLGKSNPFTDGSEFGGLFRFNVDTMDWETIVAGSYAFSSVAVVAIPEPSGLAVLAILGIGQVLKRRRTM